MRLTNVFLAVAWVATFVMVGDEVHASCTKTQCDAASVVVTSNQPLAGAFYTAPQSLCMYSTGGNNGQPIAVKGDPPPTIQFTVGGTITGQNCTNVPSAGAGMPTQGAVKFTTALYTCGGAYNCP